MRGNLWWMESLRLSLSKSGAILFSFVFFREDRFDVKISYFIVKARSSDQWSVRRGKRACPPQHWFTVHGMTLQIKLYWDGLVKAILLNLYKVVADRMSYWYCNLRRDYCYLPSIPFVIIICHTRVTAIESSYYFGVMKFWRESSPPPTQHSTSLCIDVPT